MNVFSAVGFFSGRAVETLSAAVLLGFANPPASAAIAGNADTVVTLDWKSLDRNQTITEVWVSDAFARNIDPGYGLYPHRSQRVQYVIACEDRSSALSQWLLSDETAGFGQYGPGGKIR